MTPPAFSDIQAAMQRLQGKVKRTPIVESTLLNKWLGHRILFKAECLQTVGAFKLRGALNMLARCAEENRLPRRVVANSSGNHAQAVAQAASMYQLPVTIYAARSISPVKAAATRSYGAQLELFDTRPQADEAIKLAAQEESTLWIPPFDHADIIAGQGTAALEALEDAGPVDAVFAPCGGGGLLSGTLLATRHLQPEAKVIGAEPEQANDAAMSLQSGVIEQLTGTPDTLADGAATPSVGVQTFEFLQQLDDFYEVNEVQIAYWTQWLQHLLKLHIEPTCAMTMAAVTAWAVENPTPGTALVMLSGGNISATSMQKIWAQDYLLQPPVITNPEQ
ncbi:serine/threonine dehydratase [Salinimonas lutimaris]|uniref:serine/threonine dehydratase n=1 Tax=Salinimonas lutimaris TaxID=914153 RepID=UPI0010BFD01F|nr:serine/threonine dehydratase [Salinimonas lutimaris]